MKQIYNKIALKLNKQLYEEGKITYKMYMEAVNHILKRI